MKYNFVILWSYFDNKIWNKTKLIKLICYKVIEIHSKMYCQFKKYANICVNTKPPLYTRSLLNTSLSVIEVVYIYIYSVCEQIMHCAARQSWFDRFLLCRVWSLLLSIGGGSLVIIVIGWGPVLPLPCPHQLDGVHPKPAACLKSYCTQ